MTDASVPIIPGRPAEPDDVEDDEIEDYDDEDYEAEDPPTKDRATTVKLALIGAGVVAVIAACIFGSLRTNGRPTDGVDAQIACKNFVKDRLKAPSTADFSGVTNSGSAPTWTVTGAVDAENSFGAKLRMNFTCVVRDEGKSWRLQSLTGIS